MKHTEEWKRMMSERMKGNKFNLGKHRSPEVIEKTASKLRGRKYPFRALSEEHKRKIGLSKLGKKRKPFSEEWRAKIRTNFLKRGWVGENSPSWKGDRVGYKGVHHWITRELGPAKLFPCSLCKKTTGRREWANLDALYKRETVSWAVMCKKCHSNYDQAHFGSYTWTEESKDKMSLKALERWKVARAKGLKRL